MANLPTTQILTRQHIVAGLKSLGLAAGDHVMVHSSFKSLGPVEGGPLAVIEALMEVLSPEGMLLMPSFNQGQAFEAGAPGVFDPTSTPTINGIIPQTFWQLPGVLRSLSPTHSFAAWGRYAEPYTRYHHRTLTLGADSPLGRLASAGGYGLLIGVDYKVNTYHHVVETIVGAPCLGRRTVALPVRLPDGRTVPGRTWGWRGRGCQITDGVRYAAEMERQRFDRQIRIGQATVTCFRYLDCFPVIANLLASGTDTWPSCANCPVRPPLDERTVPSDWDEQNGCLRPDSLAWSY